MVENKTLLNTEQIALSFKFAYNSMKNTRRLSIASFFVLIFSNVFLGQPVWWWNLSWFGCLVASSIFYLICKKNLNKKVDAVDYEITYSYKFSDKIELTIDHENSNYTFEYKKLNRVKIIENIYYLYFNKMVLIVDVNNFKEEEKEFFINKIK